MSEIEIDATPAAEDRALVAAIVERGDRLMYAADNFADRSEFAAAREAFRRMEEREVRLVAFFQMIAPRIAAEGDVLDAIRSVEETLDPEWTMPPLDAKLSSGIATEES